MIRAIDNYFERDGEKIGWIRDKRVYNHEGEKLGYYTDKYVFDMKGNKLGYIQGEYFYTMDDKKTRLEELNSHVEGGAYSDIERAAVRMFLGD